MNMNENQTQTKKEVYDRVCRTLTDWENKECVAFDLYCMLVDIQALWEDVITAQD